MSDNKIIVGYTTTEHLLLDLDYTTQKKAQGLCNLLIKDYPEIGDVLILLSSSREAHTYLKPNSLGILQEWCSYPSYHVVTDNRIGYKRCVEIIHTLVLLDVLEAEFKKIREFRGDMTLRVSPKVLSNKIRPAPSPIWYIKNEFCRRHDGMIYEYMNLYNAVNRLFG